MFGRDEKVSAIRLTATQYIILAIFLVLAYGLWRLQVMQSNVYATLAEKNRVRNVPILAPRGKILDREGRVIVDNYPSFSALLLRDSSRDLNADADLIAQGLHLDPNEVRARIRHFSSMPQYQPIFLKEDITPDELAFIDAHRNELPELDTIMAHRRLYPRNGFMAHLIGYVGEVTEDMLNQPQFELYNPGDVVGISGVERQYNNVLMGTNGARREVVNSHGREVGLLGETDAIPGKQLKLTVDIDLQIAAEEALEGKNGAIVAMDPRTGEILAMVSRPTFDPNDFAVHVSRDQWNKLVTDENHPLLNKAIQAQLAPGSTFKIIMATAGLQEGIAQDLHVTCSGGGTFYGRYFKCWIAARHQTHGLVDIAKGIYQSCDVFFYTLGEKLGIDRIAKYALALGMGQKTGIDLPQEVSGVMPSEEWKLKNFHQKWFAGETISVSIGQGAIAATPIQMARAFGAIASGGRLVRPHVTNPTDLPPGVIPAQSTTTDDKSIPIDPKNWEIITDAMAQVVSPVGTAAASAIKGVDMAGKTGSAQTVSNALKAKMSASQKAEYKDNGWFVGVEPRRNPEIVVCALFEEGEHGSEAAHVAAKVIQAYVEKQRQHPQKMAKAAPDKPAPDQVEVGGVWTSPDSDGDDEQKLDSGHFFLDVGYQRPLAAAVAPGVQ
ncbi:MAG TPA: penicillin-binding protein 2 [Candidatus Binatia bacterium]|nr:penicillin-binding protein 2 [Candidatus Binatia bacterium]